jgi:hypothetical protein
MLGLMPEQSSAGLVYGLKAATGGGISYSIAPTRLFSFQTTPVASFGCCFSDIGAVTFANAPINTPIDADGLAISPLHGLKAFELQKNGNNVSGSRLIDLNPITAVASVPATTPSRPVLSGRNIRGAAFDASNRLWALDSNSDQLLEIDPNAGTVLSQTPLLLNNIPFPLGFTTDLAIHRNGTFYITNASFIYTVNAGVLTQVHSDMGEGLNGAAFDSDLGVDALFAHEVNFSDDIHRYDLALGFFKSTPFPNIIPLVNSGGGDLASIVPEPASIALVSLAFFAMLGQRRPMWWRK